jgi:hypothetical protein
MADFKNIMKIHHNDETFINKKEVVRELNKLRAQILNETESIEDLQMLEKHIWQPFENLIEKYINE